MKPRLYSLPRSRHSPGGFLLVLPLGHNFMRLYAVVPRRSAPGSASVTQGADRLFNEKSRHPPVQKAPQGQFESSLRLRCSLAGPLAQLLMWFTGVLVAWYPLAATTFLEDMNGKFRNEPRQVLTQRCDFGCVLLRSLSDFTSLVGVFVVFLYFLVPESKKAATTHRDNTPVAKELEITTTPELLLFLADCVVGWGGRRN
eukprot:TRINITY_DN50_c4_g1_i1.p1 TRINITY_DN50_c4_g1~~TRINITY_DN50_c4_g1_i1.p1  ORF type:complete len:200 (-),score=36.20 TRINITY_DN50_c4_g1_i1:159-758(-)